MSNTIAHRPTHQHGRDGGAQIFDSLIGRGRARMVGDANEIAKATGHQATRPNQVTDRFAMGGSNPLDALLNGRRNQS